ncbi:hypothetical protein ACUN29_05610 [Streptomyces sp. WC2508]|uniref:hypothetical protein n=1 Tax=Streptomyces sp. WC2508 TaxID=3461405 RepID=UPI004044A719
MEHTYYYRHDNGSFSTRTVNFEGAEPPPRVPSSTEAEFNEGVAAIEAANAAKVAEEEAAAQERARLDCEALIAAGIPPETAARMSGYNPPHPTVGD